MADLPRAPIKAPQWGPLPRQDPIQAPLNLVISLYMVPFAAGDNQWPNPARRAYYQPAQPTNTLLLLTAVPALPPIRNVDLSGVHLRWSANVRQTPYSFPNTTPIIPATGGGVAATRMTMGIGT